MASHTTLIEIALKGKNTSKAVFSEGRKDLQGLAKEATPASNALNKVGQSGKNAGNQVSQGAHVAFQSLVNVNKGSQTTSTALNKVGQSGRNMGNQVARGSEVAERGLQGVTKQASSTSNGLGEMGNLLTTVTAGYGALEVGTAMWSGSTQREFNKAYLSMEMGKEKADELALSIQKIVAAVPGDDTFMNTLLQGAAIRGGSVDQLKQLGYVAADYLAASQMTGQTQIEAQQDLNAYIMTGTTGEIQRSRVLQGQVDKMENQKTVGDRILALNKALVANHFQGLSTLEVMTIKWEVMKGQIQLAATNLGEKVLPYLEQGVDFVSDLDEKTGGWSTMIGVATAGVVGLGLALGPVVWSAKELLGGFKDIGGILGRKQKLNVDCDPCGFGGTTGGGSAGGSTKNKNGKTTTRGKIGSAAITIAGAVTILGTAGIVLASSIGTVGGGESSDIYNFCKKNPKHPFCVKNKNNLNEGKYNNDGKSDIPTPTTPPTSLGTYINQNNPKPSPQKPTYTGEKPVSKNDIPPGVPTEGTTSVTGVTLPTGNLNFGFGLPSLNMSGVLDFLGLTGSGGIAGPNGSSFNLNSLFPNPQFDLGKITGGIGSWLGLGNTPDQNKANLPQGPNLLDGLFPKPASASGTGGNQGIMNDIFGPKGLLDTSTFKLPTLDDIKGWLGLGNISLPDFKLPTLDDIKAWLGIKEFKLPTLDDVFNYIKDKLGIKELKVPTLADISNWIKKKFPFTLKFPTIGSISGWIKDHMPSWLRFPTWGDISGWIQSHMPTWLKFPTWDDIANWIKARIGLGGPGLSGSGAISSAIGVARSAYNVVKPIVQPAINTAHTVWDWASNAYHSVFGGPGASIKGYVSRAAGRKSDALDNYFSNFTYEPYEGSRKTIAQTLQDMSGNCVDGTMAQIWLSAQTGVPMGAEITTWLGHPHMLAVGENGPRDVANKALTNSWARPPAGPVSSNGDTYIITVPVTGPVYGIDDLDKRIKNSAKSAMNELERGRSRRLSRK